MHALLIFVGMIYVAFGARPAQIFCGVCVVLAALFAAFIAVDVIVNIVRLG